MHLHLLYTISHEMMRLVLDVLKGNAFNGVFMNWVAFIQ